MQRSASRGKGAKIAVLFVLIPLCLLLGVTLLRDRNYQLVSMAVALLSCLPFFFTFERGKSSTRKLVLIAAMVALTVISRLVFAFLPGFKPITAMVIIMAIWFRPEAGFMTGSLTAVLSNLFFGQGPWTPFQMFIWGIIGFGAGLLAKPLRASRVLLCLYGVAGGLAFSLFMDLWTTLSMDGTFNLWRYLALLATALPYTAVYMVANVVFLLVLAKPIGEKLSRIKTKYGI